MFLNFPARQANRLHSAPAVTQRVDESSTCSSRSVKHAKNNQFPQIDSELIPNVKGQISALQSLPVEKACAEIRFSRYAAKPATRGRREVGHAAAILLTARWLIWTPTVGIQVFACSRRQFPATIWALAAPALALPEIVFCTAWPSTVPTSLTSSVVRCPSKFQCPHTSACKASKGR